MAEFPERRIHILGDSTMATVNLNLSSNNKGNPKHEKRSKGSENVDDDGVNEAKRPRTRTSSRLRDVSRGTTERTGKTRRSLPIRVEQERQPARSGKESRQSQQANRRETVGSTRKKKPSPSFLEKLRKKSLPMNLKKTMDAEKNNSDDDDDDDDETINMLVEIEKDDLFEHVGIDNDGRHQSLDTVENFENENEDKAADKGDEVGRDNGHEDKNGEIVEIVENVENEKNVDHVEKAMFDRDMNKKGEINPIMGDACSLNLNNVSSDVVGDDSTVIVDEHGLFDSDSVGDESSKLQDAITFKEIEKSKDDLVAAKLRSVNTSEKMSVSKGEGETSHDDQVPAASNNLEAGKNAFDVDRETTDNIKTNDDDATEKTGNEAMLDEPKETRDHEKGMDENKKVALNDNEQNQALTNSDVIDKATAQEADHHQNQNDSRNVMVEKSGNEKRDKHPQDCTGHNSNEQTKTNTSMNEKNDDHPQDSTPENKDKQIMNSAEEKNNNVDHQNFTSEKKDEQIKDSTNGKNKKYNNDEKPQESANEKNHEETYDFIKDKSKHNDKIINESEKTNQDVVNISDGCSSSGKDIVCAQTTAENDNNNSEKNAMVIDEGSKNSDFHGHNDHAPINIRKKNSKTVASETNSEIETNRALHCALRSLDIGENNPIVDTETGRPSRRSTGVNYNESKLFLDQVRSNQKRVINSSDLKNLNQRLKRKSLPNPPLEKSNGRRGRPSNNNSNSNSSNNFNNNSSTHVSPASEPKARSNNRTPADDDDTGRSRPSRRSLGPPPNYNESKMFLDMVVSSDGTKDSMQEEKTETRGRKKLRKSLDVPKEKVQDKEDLTGSQTSPFSGLSRKRNALLIDDGTPKRHTLRSAQAKDKRSIENALMVTNIVAQAENKKIEAALNPILSKFESEVHKIIQESQDNGIVTPPTELETTPSSIPSTSCSATSASTSAFAPSLGSESVPENPMAMDTSTNTPPHIVPPTPNLTPTNETEKEEQETTTISDECLSYMKSLTFGTNNLKLNDLVTFKMKGYSPWPGILVFHPLIDNYSQKFYDIVTGVKDLQPEDEKDPIEFRDPREAPYYYDQQAKSTFDKSKLNCFIIFCGPRRGFHRVHLNTIKRFDASKLKLGKAAHYIEAVTEAKEMETMPHEERFQYLYPDYSDSDYSDSDSESESESELEEGEEQKEKDTNDKEVKIKKKRGPPKLTEAEKQKRKEQRLLEKKRRAAELDEHKQLSKEKRQLERELAQKARHEERERIKREKREKANDLSEGLCGICFKDGYLLVCEGVCNQSFHLECLNLSEAPEKEFVCESCTTSSHSCFLCKEKSDEQEKGKTYPCSSKKCHKFYHEECIEKHAFGKIDKKTKKLTCPLHNCACCDETLSLAANNPRCVGCPRSYHKQCVPAASPVESNLIVCPSHFEYQAPGRKLKTQGKAPQSNIIFCKICFGGGKLLCCDKCPAAVCEDCCQEQFPDALKSEDNWTCADCVKGKFCVGGEMVWAKLANHRWWPSRVILPEEEDDYLLNPDRRLPNEVGIYFYGSKNVSWLSNRRIFPYCGEVITAKENTKAFNTPYNLACVECNSEFVEYEKEKEKEQEKKEKATPVPFRRIRTNLHSNDVKKILAKRSQRTQIEYDKCACQTENGEKCVDDHCMNRMLMIECNPSECDPALCKNQRLRNKERANVKVFKTKMGYWGLKTNSELQPGDLVIEYVGEVISLEDSRNRLRQMAEDENDEFYMLSLDQDLVIDAGKIGNEARFINHSCDPNCLTQKWTVNQGGRIGIFAKQVIPPDTELTFDYQFDTGFFGEQTPQSKDKPCLCGSAICGGTMGGAKIKGYQIKRKELQEKRKLEGKRKKKKKPQKQTEDFCFICDKGGELAMCGLKRCPKVYHLECMNVEKLPHGSWICPWHCCDMCGGKAEKYCATCPTSFCSKDFTTDSSQLKPFSKQYTNKEVIANGVCSDCIEAGMDFKEEQSKNLLMLGSSQS